MEDSRGVGGTHLTADEFILLLRELLPGIFVQQVSVNIVGHLEGIRFNKRGKELTAWLLYGYTQFMLHVEQGDCTVKRFQGSELTRRNARRIAWEVLTLLEG